MGMNLDGALYLQRHGFLTPTKNRLLDIGPQNVYSITPEQIDEFVAGHGGASISPSALDLAKRKLVYFSTPRPKERTTLLSEITDLVGIQYNSIDVCPGLKTEILDLNFDPLPERLRGQYDVVMNFGTTEHIFNQWNCFEVIHDATKVGGVMYHQLPSTGYLDHGYYCYTPLFFKDMAAANGYEILDLFIHPCGESRLDALGLSLRAKETIFTDTPTLPEDNRVPSLNIHAVLRKTSETAFRTSLEIATAHSPVNQIIAGRYGVRESLPIVLLRAAIMRFRKAIYLFRRLTTPRPY
jgi:hypothetical protein